MFIDVIVPVSVPNTYTYGVPIELQDQIKVGQRVEVEFGKRKRYAAIVQRIHNTKPDVYDPKPVLSILDKHPVVTKQQLDFWFWMSDYYMANIGDVMAAALPSALRLSSETTVELSIDVDIDELELTDDEYLVFEALSNQQSLGISDIQLILGKKEVFPILNSLIDQRVVRIKETLHQKYKDKKEWFVRLRPEWLEAENLHTLLDELSRAPKQEQAMLAYLQITKHQPIWIPKKEWISTANVSNSVIQSLLNRNYFDTKEEVVDRIQNTEESRLDSYLTEEQIKALGEIHEGFTSKKPVLLHGITGSGKTHLYIHIIEETLRANGQCLYLLPEIALTSQIIQRLTQYFGSEIGVYHSKLSDAERVEVWKKTQQGAYKLIVGARSSLFLPFSDLQLIVVDEEHDTSYKQYDPSPRYHARDSALWLSHQFGSNCLLGSATPSFESYFNAEKGKYQLVELNQRFGQSQLPKIEVVDMNKQNIPGKTYNNFSKRLIDELRDCIEQGKQAILFRNRRGYSSIIQCGACGHVVQCVNCDVSLTYHKYKDKLECHYCGFRQEVPFRCPACGHNDMQKHGLGTQRVEEEIMVFLPKAKIGRMDWDTTRSKLGHQNIISQFERKEVDILVGTQMVTKGLDFDDVKVVGILNADRLIQFPDFRAGEHALQLFEQVSGRAGRTNNQGLVLVQARQTKNPVLEYLKKHDYVGYYQESLPERWQYKYPPFYRQIKITCKHKDWKTCYQAALFLSNELRNFERMGIKGPSEPIVSRVNNWYLQEILITMEKNHKIISKQKERIHNTIDKLHQQKGLSSVRVNIDVDPI